MSLFSLARERLRLYLKKVPTDLHSLGNKLGIPGHVLQGILDGDNMYAVYSLPLIKDLSYEAEKQGIILYSGTSYKRTEVTTDVDTGSMVNEKKLRRVKEKERLDRIRDLFDAAMAVKKEHSLTWLDMAALIGEHPKYFSGVHRRLRLGLGADEDRLRKAVSELEKAVVNRREEVKDKDTCDHSNKVLIDGTQYVQCKKCKQIWEVKDRRVVVE